MSYDYLLVKAGPDADLETLVTNAVSHAVGTAAEVQAALEALFPDLRWSKGVGESAFGRCSEAEFMLLTEADDQVRMIQMSRCERADVARVTQALGLTAIDEQSMEQFRYS
jgi:hypothetical protein